MAHARTGLGSVFSVSTDGGTTFVVVGQIKQSQFSGSKNDFEDVTNMSSPGGVRETIPTLGDPGQLALSYVFDPADAGQLVLAAAFISKVQLSCKYQDQPQGSETVGTLQTFSAYIQDNNTDRQFDKVVMGSTTLKLTGVKTTVMAH